MRRRALFDDRGSLSLLDAAVATAVLVVSLLLFEPLLTLNRRVTSLLERLERPAALLMAVSELQRDPQGTLATGATNALGRRVELRKLPSPEAGVLRVEMSLREDRRSLLLYLPDAP